MTHVDVFPIVGYVFLVVAAIAFVAAVAATVLWIVAEPDGRFTRIRPRSGAVPVAAGVVALMSGMVAAVFLG